VEKALSRRELLKPGSTAAMTGILPGCCPAKDQPTLTFQTAAPTSTPTDVPTVAVVPTDTPASAPVPVDQIRRPAIIQCYPDGLSKVVHTRYAGVWDGDELSPEAIRQMLDRSIAELTGLADGAEAWASVRTILGTLTWWS
jgi:hypothetical protein